jgi:ketosteroid isomerase-like protein
MPVTDPNDMSRAFVNAVNAGDLNALLGLYDPNVKYVLRSGKTVEGKSGVRETLERLIAAKGEMRINNKYCIVNGEIALVRAEWSFAGIGADGKPMESHGNSAEVLRCGSDGIWRYLVDSPFGAD